MKKLLKSILVSLYIILTVVCAAFIYEVLTWTTKNNPELPTPVQNMTPRTSYTGKPNRFTETPISYSKTAPQSSVDIPAKNNPGPAMPVELTRSGSLGNFAPEANKYPLDLTSGKNSAPGFVIVDDTGTVYTGLNDIVSVLGWTLLKDGSVFSDKQQNNKIMKFELNNVPSSTIIFKGRSVSLKHPVFSADGVVIVPLSDLRDLWILDFSIDPVSKSLNLSYSPR